MNSYVTPTLFHLLPILPFAFGLKWLGVATILLVLVSYIKVKKLDQQIADLRARKGSSEEVAALEQTRNFWLGLTFLRKN